MRSAQAGQQTPGAGTATRCLLDLEVASPLLIASGFGTGARVALASLLTFLAGSLPPTALRIIVSGVSVEDNESLAAFPQVAREADLALPAGMSLPEVMQQEVAARLSKLAGAGAATIRAYNAQAGAGKPLPALVLVLGDLAWEAGGAAPGQAASGTSSPALRAAWEALLQVLAVQGSRCGIQAIVVSQQPEDIPAGILTACAARLVLTASAAGLAAVLPAAATIPGGSTVVEGEVLLALGKRPAVLRLRGLRITPTEMAACAAALAAIPTALVEEDDTDEETQEELPQTGAGLGSAPSVPRSLVGAST